MKKVENWRKKNKMQHADVGLWMVEQQKKKTNKQTNKQKQKQNKKKQEKKGGWVIANRVQKLSKRGVITLI